MMDYDSTPLFFKSYLNMQADRVGISRRAATACQSPINYGLASRKGIICSWDDQTVDQFQKQREVEAQNLLERKERLKKTQFRSLSAKNVSHNLEKTLKN